MTNTKYAKIKFNDIVDGEGICVSFWTQGCPFRCPGCHNPDTWDFNGGVEIPSDIKGQIIKALSANGVQRNFSVLGGEPLCKENLDLVHSLIMAVRIAYPEIKIFVWSGFVIETLKKRAETNEKLADILKNIDVLIDGPFIQEERNITLKLRGSSNQRVLYRGQDF
jgi:anaerobic ribonucleoside-triphosphate reductase activating protein